MNRKITPKFSTKCRQLGEAIASPRLKGAPPMHEHDMQGRSSKDNEVTQEAYDHTRSFQVIDSDE
jgi:hypothetical protein